MKSLDLVEILNNEFNLVKNDKKEKNKFVRDLITKGDYELISSIISSSKRLEKLQEKRKEKIQKQIETLKEKLNEMNK